MIQRKGLITEVTELKNIQTYLSPTLITTGWSYNGTSAGTFNNIRQRFAINRPFLVEKILWDIKGAATYSLNFKSDLTTIPGTTTFPVIQNVVLGAGGTDIQFLPTNGPFLLQPGLYILELYGTVKQTVWRYGSSATGWGDSLLLMYAQNSSYDGVLYDFVFPVKLVGYIYSYSSLMESPVATV